MDRISYWKDLATYDIDTAEAMYVTRRDAGSMSALCVIKFLRR